MSPKPERPDTDPDFDHAGGNGSGSAESNADAPAPFDFTATDAPVRPSLSIRMIRHAESRNNEVYRDARRLFRGGCPDFDGPGWTQYVDSHRQADPPLSALGRRQADRLADHLVPQLIHRASHPVQIVTSPMKRTLETIRPTLHGLARHYQQEDENGGGPCPTHVVVHGFYFESEGCHLREKAEEGMNPDEISQFLSQPPSEGPDSSSAPPTPLPCTDVTFEGFPNPDRGWYVEGKTSETREEAEDRAARFYVWLMDHLDRELQGHSGVFDAGVAEEERDESDDEHDLLAPRARRRRTTLLVGHGDFMSLVLKRMVAGFCHAVEQPGLPHRSAFVHCNTGITDLEYFGCGRFLIMSHNHTPHFAPHEYADFWSGGSLKDGWSYLVPHDDHVLRAEVSVAFADELEDHVREQAQALKALYLSSRQSNALRADGNLSVETESESEPPRRDRARHFLVKRGMQVVGVATYCDKTGLVTDVAVRPSAGREVSETLFEAVKRYSKRLGRSGSLLVYPRSPQCKALFEEIGFLERSGNTSNEEKDVQPMELKH